MGEKEPVVTELFPSLAKWNAFLKSQNTSGLVERYDSNYRLRYITRQGVVNDLVFPDNNLQDKDEKPITITQYYNFKNAVNIYLSINNRRLFTELAILSPSDKLSRIVITSESSLLKMGWQNKQEVVVFLNQDYLNSLITDYIVPSNARDEIWFNKTGRDMEITAWIKGANNKNIILAPETVKRIFQDTSCDFAIDSNRRLTYGNKDKTSFNLGHVDRSLLNPDQIWSSLTGNNPSNLFIFPVNFSLIG